MMLKANKGQNWAGLQDVEVGIRSRKARKLAERSTYPSSIVRSGKETKIGNEPTSGWW